MKMIRTLLCLSAAGICTGLTAHASVLFSDGFNYTAGSELGVSGGPTQPPWTAQTGTPNTDLSIGSGNLTYSTLQDLGGNDLIVNDTANLGSFPAYATYSPVTSGSIYYSFLIECTAIPSASSYLTALTPSVSPQGTTSDALDIYGKSSGSGFEVGVRTTVGNSFESTVLSLNTPYLVVAEFTYGGNAALYLDPTPGGTQPGSASASVGVNAAITSIGAVGFKAQTSSAGDWLFDNVMVGTTWADVTPSSVPEPGTLALGGLGLAGLMIARRRR